LASAYVSCDDRLSIRFGSAPFVSKKNDIGELVPVITMPQALRLIVAAFLQDAEFIRKTLRIVEYYMKNYAKSYRSSSKRRCPLA
jgi:hypothetical protein